MLPITTAGEQGPVAGWVSTAGWANATRRVLGASWLVTPAGLVEPDVALRRGSHPRLTSDSAPSWRRRVPTVAKSAVKDVRKWRSARRFRVDTDGPWRSHDIRFVFQRHEMFHTAGLDLADALGVPSVLFVPAPLVWEAAQWGVARPGWGRWLERVAEQPAFRRAQLLACGTDTVAEQVRRLGAAPARIIVTPTGVDLDLFSAAPTEQSDVRRRLGLAGRFVVGWVGSFRRFHAIDQAVEAVAGLPDASLLLVGDGPERSRIERMANERHVHAVFTGTIAHDDLPAYLAAMDVALLLARPDQAFHYSPLKLGEYLAAGLPVIAPRVRQVADRLTDGDDALLVQPGDAGAMAAAVRLLHDDPTARARLSAAASVTAGAQWSWDHQVRRILDALS